MAGKFLNDREMSVRQPEILKEYGLDFAPQTKVKMLSVAQMQMLEIIKAVRKERRYHYYG